MILALLIAAQAAPGSAATTVAPSDLGRALHDEAQATSAQPCLADSPAEVVVCKRRDGARHYRIDPVTLETMREHDALPPKPELQAADAAPGGGCVGGQTCTGGIIPLVGVALAAVKAATLAAHGDDWRDAFRTHQDDYRAYQENKARQSSDHHVTLGVGAGN